MILNEILTNKIMWHRVCFHISLTPDVLPLHISYQVSQGDMISRPNLANQSY
jgi:hypothetical protein